MRFFFFVSALILSACSSSHIETDAGSGTDSGSSTSTYAGAYMGRGCAPDDGPAYVITLWDGAVPECTTDPTMRTLEFYFEGVAISSGTTLTSSTLAFASVSECPGGSPPYHVSSDFTLDFTAFTELASASGTYAITWTDGSTSSGSFDASWCEVTPPFCG